MQIIYNCKLIHTNGASEQSILINTLNGVLCVLSKEETEIYSKWLNLPVIVVNNHIEQKFYTSLLESGFLIQNKELEKKKEEEILKLAKNNHYKSVQKHNVVFVLTYDCNFACPYCYEINNSTCSKSYMTKC